MMLGPLASILSIPLPSTAGGCNNSHFVTQCVQEVCILMLSSH